MPLLNSNALKVVFDHVSLKVNKLVYDQIKEVRSRGATVKVSDPILEVAIFDSGLDQYN